MKKREHLAFAMVGTLVMLAGCDVETRPSPQQTAADQTTCQGYGYQPGTNRFADCMMSLANQRNDRLDRQERDAARWRQQQQQQDSGWASEQKNNQNQNTQSDSNCTSTSTTQQSGTQQSGDTTSSQTVTNTVTKCH